MVRTNPTRNDRCRRGLIGLVLCSALAFASAGCSQDAPELPVDSDNPVSGKVAYQTDAGVFVQRIGGEPALVAPGASYPRWSPDGTRLAAVDGNRIVVIRPGSGLREIARVSDPRAVAWHPDGSRVLFSDGDQVRAVAIADGKESVVARGFAFRELDVHPDGRHLVATVRSRGVRIRVFDLAGGDSRELARGCSASYSPDGSLVTNLLDGHAEIGLVSAASGGRQRLLEAPAGVTYDNQFWTNHPDWIAGETEGRRNDIILIHARNGAVYRVTDVGNAGRGDVFVE